MQRRFHGQLVELARGADRHVHIQVQPGAHQRVPLPDPLQAGPQQLLAGKLPGAQQRGGLAGRELVRFGGESGGGERHVHVGYLMFVSGDAQRHPWFE